MEHEFIRTEILIGKDAMDRLSKAKVAVFGVGGVGSYVVEALVRSGVQNFVLIDNDTVNITNINRQIIATHKTIGMAKVDVAKERLLDINPKCNVVCHQVFCLPENSDSLICDDYNYIVDAIDTVSAKLDLIVKAKERNIPIISCMGAGNKLDPTKFEVTDIYKTSMCPLAKVMRHELKQRGVDSLKVVYSTEPALKPLESEEKTSRRSIPGSIAFVPSTAGLIVASEVIKDLSFR